MATVTFENVNKMYGDFHAVKDLNLEIGDGEFMVLVGPSGCGKTTSLRMIAGLEEITAGTLRIGDRVVNDVPPKDRDIAMVFQSYALYPHMSVRENLAFGLKLRKVPKAEIERRVKEAAETIQLDKLLDRKPKELSGGQRQRVALGRAIVREPAVFLMDEPLSNLDAKLRVQTRAEIARLHQRLKTTDRLRHPRPGRGHDDGLAHRGHERGHPPAGRHAADPLRHPDQPLRRRLHRQPVDELRRRHARRLERELAARRRQRLVDPAARQYKRRRGRRPAARWSPASGRSTSTSARPAARSARSAPAPTWSSTSATRSCSTSTPPTRTSWRSSTPSIASARATSSTWSCRSTKLHLFDAETGMTVAPDLVPAEDAPPSVIESKAAAPTDEVISNAADDPTAVAS